MRTVAAAALVFALLVPGPALAQAASAPPQAKPAPQAAPAQQQKPPTPPARSATPPAKPPATGPSVTVASDFTIGPEDVLGVLFWRDQEMSGDVTVRPDGMITLPLVRDVKAAGLTPDQLADAIQKAAAEYIAEPSVTVVVRQINSRKVFITGEVAKPGAYPLPSSMTVMQLIAVAGGLTEFADTKGISIMRVEGGQSKTFPFNYKDVAKGKKREQNIVLKPGDTVVVP
jgi:polysaccharide export outer membrane protein